MPHFTGSTVEKAALAWLESIGWTVLNGSDVAPGATAAERDNYGQVILAQRLRKLLSGAVGGR